MKKKYSILFLLAVCMLQTPVLKAQLKVDKAFKEKSIQTIDKLLNDYYVFPDVAKSTGDHLKKQLEKGAFDSFNDIESFSQALTQEARSINKDKHMRIAPSSVMVTKEGILSQDEQIELMLRNLKLGKEEMAGFIEAKKLKGNIGYVDLRSFPPPNDGAPIADAYMKLLQNSDAVIIDLRRNSGGSPAMVQYLCSYFFDNKVHLNSIYSREANSTKEFWTLDKVNGEKLPEVPLFVLTSNHTFSGAEEFSYNMQTQKRATLIGETTGGGANPAGPRRINDHLVIFVPDGTSINPITKKNWEGIGVIPEVKTTTEAAFDKGVELATKAAEEYRQKKYTVSKALLNEIFSSIEKAAANPVFDQNDVTYLFKKAVDKGLFRENDINNLGYAELESNHLKRAEIIFKANTTIFPNSANAYDSYGDALVKNNKRELARTAYEKAIEIGTQTDDPNTELFKGNLNKLKGNDD